jgi:predicted DNA binding CopG/RHH family protein
MKALQRFTEEYLEGCRDMTSDQIIQFLDDFRRLHGSKPAPSRLISIKVPVDLLNTFKTKAAIANTPYQTQIKALMKAWILEPPE